jgi:predicted exporter
MRWFVASIAAVVVLLLTFPVLAAGSSDGPGQCTTAIGIRTLGNSETCDTWGLVVSLPAAVVVFVLIAWGWKRLRADED